MTTTPPLPHKNPLVGVGCIVVRGDGRLLMVQNHRGFWSTPGGHLDFGESPGACAARETLEETGVRVGAVEFVAVTSDVLPDAGRHYITIWMRADVADSRVVIGDPAEIAAADWFAPDDLPKPRHPYFENLLAGRSLPAAPVNLPVRVAAQRSVPSAESGESECPFCRYLDGRDPCVFVARGPTVSSFMNRTQYDRGAMLVVPNAHVVTVMEAPDAVVAAVHLEARRLAIRAVDVLGAIGVNVFQNNGAAAGQSVDHYHVHVVPRYPGSDPARRFREHDFPHTAPAELEALAERLRA